MKLIKRKFANLTTTMNIWFIPTLVYGLQKSLGTIISNEEWYWWVGISVAFLIWLTISFKIVKNK